MKTMYQIKFAGDNRYELICYDTRDEAETVAKDVGLGYTIRSVRVRV